MSPSDSEDELWFVIECHEDDSISLVPKAQIISTDVNTIKIGEKVTFSIGDKCYIGVVRYFGGGYYEMRRKQTLAQKQSKEKKASFHEDKPRSAALKAAGKWAILKPKSSLGKDKHQLLPSKGGTADTNDSCSAMDVDDNAPSSPNATGTDSDSSVEKSPEVQAYLDKMAEKQRQNDLRLLKRRLLVSRVQKLSQDRHVTTPITEDGEAGRTKETPVTEDVELERQETVQVKSVPAAISSGSGLLPPPSDRIQEHDAEISSGSDLLPLPALPVTEDVELERQETMQVQSVPAVISSGSGLLPLPALPVTEDVELERQETMQVQSVPAEISSGSGLLPPPRDRIEGHGAEISSEVISDRNEEHDCVIDKAGKKTNQWDIPRRSGLNQAMNSLLSEGRSDKRALAMAEPV